MPRRLQQIIHQEFRADLGVWFQLQAQVIAISTQNGIRTHDINDHLIREYNRRVVRLGLADDNFDPNNLIIDPHDAGFRYLGPQP